MNPALYERLRLDRIWAAKRWGWEAWWASSVALGGLLERGSWGSLGGPGRSQAARISAT